MTVGQPGSVSVSFQVWAGSAPGRRDGGLQSPWVGGSSPAEPSAPPRTCQQVGLMLPQGPPQGPASGVAHKRGPHSCLLAEASLEGPAAAGGAPGELRQAAVMRKGVLAPAARPRAFCQVPAGFRPRAIPGSGYLVFGSRRRGLCHEVASISSSPSSVPHFISRQGLNLR